MKISVIGGGAAGFMGAITTARTNPEAKVTIFEATHQPLDKVRISGGGRCNVTHNCFEPSELIKNYPRGSKELLGPLNKFGPKEVIAWFRHENVKLKAENDGRMFPVTDDSRTVIDCLKSCAKKAGVFVKLGCRIKQVDISNARSGKFEITFFDGQNDKFDFVLLSTGNSPDGYKIAESTGHKITPRVPSLFTFKVNDERLNELSGVSFENVKLVLRVGDKFELKQNGPMLITHWGLSGPAVLKLSAWGAVPLFESRYKAKLLVNFLPGFDQDSLKEFFNNQKEKSPKKLIHSATGLSIPSRYWKKLVTASGINETTNWSNITKQQTQSLSAQLLKTEFEIRGKGIFKEEFVTCGGIDLKEIDFKTMQSKRCPGIFFAGEILDIDGITGGFNFQSAWTTGWIAGQNICQS